MGNGFMDPNDFSTDPRFWEICGQMHDMMKVHQHPLSEHCRMGHGRLRRAEIEANKHWEYPWCVIHGDFLPGQHVLDAGAGRGVLQYYLAHQGCLMATCDLDGFRSKRLLKAQRFLNRVGVAPEPDLTARLRKNAKFFGVEIDVHIEPIQQLSWPDESFDRVYSISVLEHIQPAENAQAALAQLGRVLKRGGKMILTVDLSTGPERKTGEVFYPKHLEKFPEWSGCDPIELPDLSILNDWDAYARHLQKFTGGRLPDYTAVGMVLRKP